MSEPTTEATGAPAERVTLLAIAAGVCLAAAIVLRTMGRAWWCKCGQPDLWSWHVWSMHNSQHVIDPYTFSHVLHGLIFYWLTWLALGSRPLWLRFGVALGAEALWEILENTNAMIERYRETTISLDYFGDSVINSMADILAAGGGFLLAGTLPVWMSVLGFVLTEIVLLLWIRDCLSLNVLMLVWPLEAVKEWQLHAQ